MMPDSRPSAATTSAIDSAGADRAPAREVQLRGLEQFFGLSQFTTPQHRRPVPQLDGEDSEQRAAPVSERAELVP